MSLSYFVDLANTGNKTQPSQSPSGYNAWIINAGQIPTFRSVELSAHQGYTANADSSQHWTTDDLYEPTGKLQRWNDNGGTWTSDLITTGILTAIQNFNPPTTTPIDHIGGCSHYDNGSTGQIFVAVNHNIGDTSNALAIFDATSHALGHVCMITGPADANSCAVYNGEVYVCSNNQVGVDVYSLSEVSTQATATPLRSITFDQGAPFQNFGNGIFVNATGIYLSTGSHFPHYSLTGEFIAAVHHDNTRNPTTPYNDTGGPEDIHVHNDQLRIMFDGGTNNAFVKYYPAPLVSRGISNADGYTMSGNGTDDSGSMLFIDDTAAGNFPAQGTIFMRWRANRFFDSTTNGYGNTLFSNNRNRFHHRCICFADGTIGWYPHDSSSVTSIPLTDPNAFYTVAIVWESTGVTLTRANIYIDGVAAGPDRTTGPWNNQNKFYGYGGMGEYQYIMNGEGTYRYIAQYTTALTEAEIQAFTWPIAAAQASALSSSGTLSRDLLSR